MNRRSLLFLFFALALIASNSLPGSPLVTPPVEAQILGAGAQRAPCLAIDKFDSVYLTMSVATKPASAHTPGSQTFFMQSDDGGVGWNNLPITRRLTNSDGETFGPSMGVNKVGKARTYIVYHDNTPGPTQVFLAASKKGVKFKKPRNITPHNGGAFVPRIAMDTAVEALNIVWGDTFLNKRVVFTRSTDQGETFSELVDVSRSSGDAFEPEIAIDKNDNINVIWEDTVTGNKSIMFARSTNHGQSFSEPRRISKGMGDSVEPDVAVDESGRIYIAWSENTATDIQLMLSRSTDGGATFSEPKNLSNNPGAEMHKVAIVASGNGVFIAYNNDESRSRQVFVLRSGNAGDSFDDPVQISNANKDRGRAHSAALALDSKGVLHIAWIDSSVLGNDEGLLFYSNSGNARNFSGPKMLLAIVTAS